MMVKKSYQITVHGRVQHVGFRYNTHEKAISLGITGFVKNLQTGEVYIEAEGEPEKLSLFIAWCHQGPTRARIMQVIIIEQPLAQYSSFVIKN